MSPLKVWPPPPPPPLLMFCLGYEHMPLRAVPPLWAYMGLPGVYLAMTHGQPSLSNVLAGEGNADAIYSFLRKAD